MLPVELQQLLDQIDACERRAEVLVGDLDDATVNWRPPTGGWSVAQCLHHLAVINEFYLRDCLTPVQQAPRGTRFSNLSPTPLGLWFVSSLEPPVRIKMRARSDVQPAPSLSRNDLIPTYKRSHDAYRTLVQASADVDINRVIVPNPFFPRIRMRMSTILLVVPAHDRRHLWQAENVKRLLRSP